MNRPNGPSRASTSVSDTLEHYATRADLSEMETRITKDMNSLLWKLLTIMVALIAIVATLTAAIVRILV